MTISTTHAVNAAKTKPICRLDPEKKKTKKSLNIYRALAILDYNFNNNSSLFKT